MDAGRKTPDIHLNGRDHAAANDTDGFRKVAGILRDGGAERVVMEAARRKHRALRQSRDFAKAAGDLAKTGRVDAVVPAAFGAGDPDPDGLIPKVLPKIEAGVRDCDRRVAEPVAGSEELAGSRGIPMPVPGIGPAAAAALIAWTCGPGAIGSRQAAALVGVAPFAL